MLARAEADELRVIVQGALESVEAATEALMKDPEAAIDDLAAARLMLVTALSKI